MTKIEALIKTIYNLENDVYEYNWSSSNSCNCGILARTLLNGKSPLECGYLHSPKRGDDGVFAANAFCMTTNLPLPEVFQTLKDAGFTYEELLNLEFYGDQRIADKLGYKIVRTENGSPFGYSGVILDNKPLVIKYLKAWVSILQEEEETRTQPVKTPSIEAPAVTPKVVTKTVYVAIPESITSQTKELILS